MRILRWLERKLFTGEVLRDYGVLGELAGRPGPGEVSLLLCKRRGQLHLVLRTRGHFELSWYPIKATSGVAARLAAVAEDLRRAVQTETSDAIPATPPQEEETRFFERRR